MEGFQQKSDKVISAGRYWMTHHNPGPGSNKTLFTKSSRQSTAHSLSVSFC